MHLAQIVASLETRHGGPSQSVPNLAQGLADLGHRVDLLATGSETCAAVTTGQLTTEVFPRERPSFLSPSAGLQARLRQCAADVIHHHGLWLRPLHYARQEARRRRVPLVISPRGMMSVWAWQHRSWRKFLARTFVHPGAFRHASGWHATSAEEADDIRRLGFRQPICVAPNGTVAPDSAAVEQARRHWLEAAPETRQRPTALFYSRFHRKKRVLELIDLWLAHAPKEWLLLMIGLADEYTAPQLENYVLRASGGDRVQVFAGEDRPAPYAVASLFLLPSLSENFGLVIAEAMAHGLPVLVTDATPWTGVNRIGAGWCVPFDRYPETLTNALKEGAASLSARGSTAKHYVLQEYSWQKAAETLAGFYAELKPAPTRT